MSVDTALAQQWLSNVSYYRLSGYWYPARIIGPNGVREDSFRPGTTFKDVVELYEADRKLRTLLHDGMERVEITFRTRITDLLSVADPLRYRDPKTFRPTFHHQTWMETANKRVNRAGRYNQSIQHYQREYGGKYPLWVLAEVLDFSDVSKLFQGMRARDQLTICQGLGINIDTSKFSRNLRRKVHKNSPLARWLEQLTIVRNTCAHHGRLWNKALVPVQTTALRTQNDFKSLPKGQSERIFGSIVVMTYIVRQASPGTTWPDKVANLLTDGFLPNPLVTRKALGIPENWDGRF